MTALRRWHRLAFALLLCLAAAACAGGTGQPGEQEQTAAGQPSGQGPAAGGGGQDSGGGGGGQPSGGGGGGAPGSPSNRRNGAQAKGSPLKLPAFQQEGQPLYEVDGQAGVQQQIEERIRELCTPDHDQCVTTVVKPLEGSAYHPCRFAGKTDPPTDSEGTEIDRGKVLTIYSGSNDQGEPCTSSPDSGTDQQPTDTTEGSAPSETTNPTEDSQPPSTS